MTKVVSRRRDGLLPVGGRAFLPSRNQPDQRRRRWIATVAALGNPTPRFRAWRRRETSLPLDPSSRRRYRSPSAHPSTKSREPLEPDRGASAKSPPTHRPVKRSRRGRFPRRCSSVQIRNHTGTVPTNWWDPSNSGPQRCTPVCNCRLSNLPPYF